MVGCLPFAKLVIGCLDVRCQVSEWVAWLAQGLPPLGISKLVEAPFGSLGRRHKWLPVVKAVLSCSVWELHSSICLSCFIILSLVGFKRNSSLLDVLFSFCSGVFTKWKHSFAQMEASQSDPKTVGRFWSPLKCQGCENSVPQLGANLTQ